MARNGCLLLETASGWRITATVGAHPPVEEIAGPETVPSALAEAVEGFVSRHRLSQRRLLIAPSAASTLFARFPVDAVGSTRNRNALTYQMEASLPFDAEDIVADFQRGATLVSGVAVERGRWLPLVDALEERGLRVQSIVPAAVLACQSLLESPAKPKSDVIVWQAQDECDLFRFDGRQLVQWRHVAGRPVSLARELMLEVERKTLSVAVVNGDSALRRALAASGVGDVGEIATTPLADHAQGFARLVLQGTRTPWFELRRGELTNGDPHRAYRSSLRAMKVAAAMILVTLSAAFLWKSMQHKQQLAGIQQQQETLFREAFPGSPVPRAIVSRIESEHAKVIGSRRTGDDVVLPQSALDVLRSLLTGLPENIRSRVTEIRIENGELDLDVELRAHNDAGLMAAALETAGFSITPPKTTQREDRTIESRLEGVWTGAQVNPVRGAGL